MKKSPSSPVKLQTWREIKQSVNPRAMSPEGRKRFLLTSAKIAGICLGVIGLAGGIVALTTGWASDSRHFQSAADKVPLKEIVVLNDGVLGQKWVKQTLALPKGMGLRTIDLLQSQAKLQRYGQIKTVVLTRSFPATLIVEIKERSPVARIVLEEKGKRQTYLISRDGFIYEGIGYDAKLLNNLPFLAGVKVAKTKEGYAPIEGMETAADLLGVAQNQAPHLYKTWKVISLARLENYGEIIVQTREIAEAVFTCAEDFSKQLARLDYVVDYARTQNGPRLQKVDLSLGSQVAAGLSANKLPAKSTAKTKRKTNSDL